MSGRDRRETLPTGGPRDPGGLLAAALLTALAAGAAGAVGACSEAGLTTGPGDEAPGSSAETREVIVPVTDFAFWRDSTFEGFATTSTVSRLLVAQDSVFQSRALLRFEAVPDTVIINAQLLPIDSVGGIEFRFGLDTTRSVVGEDSATISVFTLDRHFDPGQAGWTRAAEGDPWTPGGGIVRRLGRTRVPVSVDTFSIGVHVNPDSLWRAWKEDGSPPSMAITVDGPSNRVSLRNAVLQFRGSPPDQDTLATASSVVEERTYIYDPAQPGPGRRLRLGGVPSSRAYMAFTPPDSVAGVPLRGSQINRADLLLQPVGPVSRLFRPNGTIDGVALQLLADPFELGAKTPVGGGVSGGPLFQLLPDSLEAGRPLEVSVTDLFAAWARMPPDSTARFRIGLRPLPDGSRFGYWEFGSARADSAALRPRVRILFTPPTSFELP